MSRFKVSYQDQLIGDYPSAWDAREAGVAYMRKNFVSPVMITDTELTEFNISRLSIEAYEGPPEVVAARRLLANRMPSNNPAPV